MIETKMPKDIRSYKTKLIGPFTMRQIIFVAVMVVVDFILYALVIQPFQLSAEFIIYGLIFVDVPIGAFGWIEPQGLPLEKYIKDILLRSFIAPVKRKPQHVLHEDPQKEETPKKKKTKKNPDEPKSFQ